MKFRILFAICALFGLPLAANACACDNAPPGTCAGLQPTDVVFLGTVTDIQPVVQAPLSQQLATPAESGAPSETPAPTATSPSATPIIRYHFRIDEKFAGSDAHEIDVFSGGDDGDCGFKFAKGAQYVVYTQTEGQGGYLFVTICNGTRLAADGLALIPQLRAMRDGTRVANVFGVLRRSDPPFLSPPDDPDDPVPDTALKLRSQLDRFQANTNDKGVFSFFDVLAGEYNFTADLPEGTQLTGKTLVGPLPSLALPDNACYEYDVYALPTGHIGGSVLGPDGKPLGLASVELYRAGTYADKKPGYWTFQGMSGVFNFDHVGPGQYVLVYNRTNRKDPNSPFPRMFYPGVPNAADAQPIELKDGQDLQDVALTVSNGYPVRTLKVHVKWTGPELDGDVTVAAKAAHGENPAADYISDNVYSFTLFPSDNYTISAWENLAAPENPPAPKKGKKQICALPARIDTPTLPVSGDDPNADDVTLVFPKPDCLTN